MTFHDLVLTSSPVTPKLFQSAKNKLWVNAYTVQLSEIESSSVSMHEFESASMHSNNLCAEVAAKCGPSKSGIVSMMSTNPTITS